MKIRVLSILGALACAGLVAFPAPANDGGGEPAKDAPASSAPKQGDKPSGDAAKECKDAPAGAVKKSGSPCGEGSVCRPDCQGPADGEELCAEGMAKRNALVVTVAAATGEGDAAKKVLGSIPAEASKKVEEARKAFVDTMVKIRVEMKGLQKEFEALAEQAKASGKALACDAETTLKNDAACLRKKCSESAESFGKVLGEVLGAERIQALAGEVGKAEEVLKAFGDKINAAAVKVEAEKAAKAKAARAKCDDDDDGDEDDDDADDDEEEDDDDAPPCKGGKCEKAEKCEKAGKVD